MNPQKLQDMLDSLRALVGGWEDSVSVPALERDLALEKLRRLYDAVLGFGVADGLPSGTGLPGVLPAAAAPCASPDPEDPEVEVELLFDDGGTIGMQSAVETGEEDIEIELLYAEPEETAGGDEAGTKGQGGPVPVPEASATAPDGEYVEEPEGLSDGKPAAAPDGAPAGESLAEPEPRAVPQPDAPGGGEASQEGPGKSPGGDSAGLVPEEPVAAPAGVSDGQAGEPRPARPLNATLFGPEPEHEMARHRHRQRVIMSLYGAGPAPAPKRTVPAAEQPVAQPEPAAPACPEPPVPPAPEPETVPAAEHSIPVAEHSVPAAGDGRPLSAASAEPLGLGLDEIMLPSGAVLGEVINHDRQTLADTIPAPHDVAFELSRRGMVGDLRRAVGLNDRFLMIRDLFDGDAAACDETLAVLNDLPDLDECVIWIAEHFAWNPDSDGARLLMELLERKYA